MRGLFVTGTDTEVGKTYISCLILREMKQTGRNVGAYKPVCSGADETADGKLTWTDRDRLRDAIGGLYSPELVGPQTFREALAPPRAARLEGRTVDENRLRGGILSWRDKVDWLLVEGAGGLLSPLSAQHDNASLAREIGFPLLIVARAGLGTLNHTLLTIEAAQSRGLKIAGVVLNEVQPAGDDLSIHYNFEDLKSRTSVPLLGLCRFGKRTFTDENGAEVPALPEQLFDFSPAFR